MQKKEPTKEPDLQLAGAWRRFFARSIDLWLTTLASVFLGAMVLGLTSPAFSIWMQDPTSAAIFAWMMFPTAMVTDAAVVAAFGNSLGKSLLGVRVRSMDGKALQFSAICSGISTYGFTVLDSAFL